MNKKFFTLIACTALLLGSCTTIRKTATTAEVQHNLTQYPTVADLNVMEKTEASTEWFSLRNPTSKLKRMKGNLVAETIAGKGADVLLEPQFIITKFGLFRRKITVFGYPAKYTNFRKATDADLKALKAAGEAPETETTKYNTKIGLF